MCQKIVRKYLGFSMLFRGLGRLRSLTLATPDFFGTWLYTKEKLKNSVDRGPHREKDRRGRRRFDHRPRLPRGEPVWHE